MMNTRYIAQELRLSHWAGIMRERKESGLTIKAFCESSGIYPNVYFYWQRKLREATCQTFITESQNEPIENKNPGVPDGWAICQPAFETKEKPLPIEINGCRVLVSADTDPELLAKTCKVLMSLC